MKIMKLLHQLNNFFCILFVFLIVSATSFAETKWEVAIVFLDKGPDVAANIKEIQSLEKNPNLAINIFTRAIEELPLFLEQTFKDQDSKKSLIIYSHGRGLEGLESINTLELKDMISAHTPHLDILWFDACFMANIEFLYELKDLSSFTIASEDAEFSSGMPFQSLNQLPLMSTASSASLMLARDFIESYSYVKNGSQRNYVSESSSTITVFDNSKWDLLVTNLNLIAKKMKELSLNFTYLLKYFTMENQELVDLGHLLISMRASTKDHNFDKLLTSTIRLLNIQSIRKLKTNPRIKIINPDTTSIMVFGFNNWAIGNQADFLNNSVLTQIVHYDNFILGPKQVSWPYKKVSTKTTTITPFAPNLNIFNYYFLNKSGTKLLSNSETVYRTSDIVEIERENINSPLLYSAYTQEIGKNAERYTGLSITLPKTIPTLDYYQLNFNQLVHWLNL